MKRDNYGCFYGNMEAKTSQKREVLLNDRPICRSKTLQLSNASLTKPGRIVSERLESSHWDRMYVHDTSREVLNMRTHMKLCAFAWQPIHISNLCRWSAADIFAVCKCQLWSRGIHIPDLPAWALVASGLGAGGLFYYINYHRKSNLARDNSFAAAGELAGLQSGLKEFDGYSS